MYVIFKIENFKPNNELITYRKTGEVNYSNKFISTKNTNHFIYYQNIYT